MNKPVGYFKLWRELFDKPIWYRSSPEQRVILITLLAMANYKSIMYKSTLINPGQFVTSLSMIADKVGGVTVSQVRTALSRFEKAGFLTNTKLDNGRLITIVNWSQYQSSEDDVEEKKSKGKKVVKVEEVVAEKENYAEFEKKVIDTYPGKKDKGVRDRKLKPLLKRHGADNLERCIVRYAEEVKDRDKRYILNEGTFWNTKYKNYLDENYEPSNTNEIKKKTSKLHNFEQQYDKMSEEELEKMARKN